MDFNTIGSISAMLIGVCALAISIWQGIETRNNNKLAVTPKLTILCNFLPSGEYSGICIRNKGIGPAIIKNIQYIYEDQHYSTENLHVLFQKITSEKFPDSNLWNLCVFVIDSETFISPNEEVKIIWLNEEDRNRENISELNRLLENVTLKIEYSSLYNQVYFLNTTFSVLLDEEGYRK